MSELKQRLEWGWDKVEMSELKTLQDFGAELRYGITHKLLAGLEYLNESGEGKLTATEDGDEYTGKIKEKM